MTVSDALVNLRQALRPLYSPPEADAVTIWAMESLSGKDRLAQLRDADLELSKQQEQQWQHYTEELLKGRPVQYVTETSYFFGLKLRVNEAVLIPRPETEELVAWALQQRRAMPRSSCSILDIGTGSGCIALAYQQACPDDKVVAVDISEAALSLARENAVACQLPVQFVCTDILKGAKALGERVFDIILSNPPYITLAERQDMARHVLDFEPASALFVSNGDPLQFYKAIAVYAGRALVPGGRLLLEVHQDFARDTKAFYAATGWHTELRNDLNGNARMLLASR